MRKVHGSPDVRDILHACTNDEKILVRRSRVKSTKNKYLGSGERDKVGRRKGSAFFKRYR